jgi:DNA primase
MSTPQIEEIKQKLDIVQVVGKYVKDLHKAGRNFQGLCPFHNEKSPSFSVNPELGIFKCFGCGEGGDVISFIQKIERVEFPEALKVAAEMAGIKLEESNTPAQERMRAEKKRLVEANTTVAKYYNYLLTEHAAGKNALAYANKRGLDAEMIKKFNLGYAPDGDNLSKFMQNKGFNPKELIDFGFSVERHGRIYDKFRERLVFPIYSLKGEVVGFSARTLVKDGIPKFLNSPETILYKKSELPYGFYQGKEAIRKQGFVIFFEGNVDIVNSHRVGVENVACPLGTAITPEQLKLVKRYAEKVYFCFDTDTAGYKALLRGIEIAENLGMQHRVVNIGKYHDADELIMAEPALWPKQVAKADNSISYVMNRLLQQYDLGTADGKLGFRDAALTVLRLVRDQVELSHFIQKISKLLDVSDDVLLTMLRKAHTAQPVVVDEKQVQQEKEMAIHEFFNRPSVVEDFISVLLEAQKPLTFEVDAQVFQGKYKLAVNTIIEKQISSANIQSSITTLDDDLRNLLTRIYIDKNKYKFSNERELITELESMYLLIRKKHMESSIKELGPRVDMLDDLSLELFNKFTKAIKQSDARLAQIRLEKIKPKRDAKDQ